MRLGALLLLCGLMSGCGGSEPATSSQASSSGAPSEGTATAPAAKEPEDLVTLSCTGKVLTARESPTNKADPSLGGHWIVEVEIEEWSTADEREQPSEPLRLIVPKEVVATLARPPMKGDTVATEAKLVAGKTATATAEALRTVE